MTGKEKEKRYPISFKEQRSNVVLIKYVEHWYEKRLNLEQNWDFKQNLSKEVYIKEKLYSYSRASNKQQTHRTNHA